VGNRIRQTASSVLTTYLNDVQSELPQLLAETTSGDTTRYVHGVRGIQSIRSNAGVWSYIMQDMLGSVRGKVDDNAQIVSTHSYNPIGMPNGSYGKGFGYTGEYTDANNLLYLRARYYAPNMGVFTALDPIEGMLNNALTYNRYSYVGGNPIKRTDPSGEAWQNALADMLEPAYHGFQNASQMAQDNAFWDWTENRLSELENTTLNAINWAHDNFAWEYYPAIESFRKNIVCNLLPMGCSPGASSNPYKTALGFEQFRNDMRMLDCLPLEVRRELGYQMFAQPLAQHLQQSAYNPISRINQSLDQENFLDAYLGSFDLMAQGNIYETREGWVTRDPVRFVSGAVGTTVAFAQGYGVYMRLRTLTIRGFNAANNFGSMFNRNSPSRTFVADTGLFASRLGKNNQRVIADAILADSSNRIIVPRAVIEELNLRYILSLEARGRSAREQLWCLITARAQINIVNNPSLPAGHGNLLGARFSENDLLVVQTASNERQTLITANVRLPNQIASNLSRSNLFGHVRILVLEVDIPSAASLSSIIP
jgi:RHS repeat-associated protein